MLAAWEGELATIQASVEGDKTSSALEKETKLIDPEKKLPFKISIPKIDLEWMVNEEFTYIVTGKAVLPTDLTVLENTDYSSLVLSTCTPKYLATRRLIIFAKIIGQLPD